MLHNGNTSTPSRMRDVAVDAVIALLAEIWPACFTVYERRRRPLKLGIHHDILAALDGAITLQSSTGLYAITTGSTWYLRATVAGAARGLDDNPAGAVNAEEAAAAAARLASYRRRRRPAPIPATPPTPPKRISLADLRREAQLRKAQEAAAAPAGAA